MPSKKEKEEIIARYYENCEDDPGSIAVRDVVRRSMLVRFVQMIC